MKAMDQAGHYSAEELPDKIKESEGAVRNRLIRILLHEKEGGPFVNKLLQTNNRKLRYAILRLLTPENVLENMKVLAQLLQDKDMSNRKIILNKLGTAKDPAAEKALLEFLKRKSPKNHLLKMAIASLGNTGGPASVKILMNGFEKYNEDIKVAALMALNKIRSDKAIFLYKKALHDPSAPVRLWALKSLKPFYRQVHRSEIIKMIREEDTIQNQAYAIRLLSRYKDADVCDFLISLLFDPHFISIKYVILTGLNKFPLPEIEKIFDKKIKEVTIEKEKKVLEDALNYLRNDSLIQGATHPLYKTWIRDPLSFTDISLLSFLINNEGIYREEKAGEVEINLPFEFRMEEDRLSFIVANEEKVVSFSISSEECDHPYEGKSPCLVLNFKGPDVYIGRINITGSSYYYLIDDI